MGKVSILGSVLLLLIVLNGIEMHASGLVPSENPNF